MSLCLEVCMKKQTLEELFDDEDFSDYYLWLDDLDNIRSIIFDIAKKSKFSKVYLYGEYTHPLAHERKDKVVRITTQSDNRTLSKNEILEEWDRLENALSGYPVVFIDYDYLISGKAYTGVKPDDLTMFRFGNWMLYSGELKSKEDLKYIFCERDLTENEMLEICHLN